jgi:hypothetical protein
MVSIIKLFVALALAASQVAGQKITVSAVRSPSDAEECTTAGPADKHRRKRNFVRKPSSDSLYSLIVNLQHTPIWLTSSAATAAAAV